MYTAALSCIAAGKQRNRNTPTEMSDYDPEGSALPSPHALPAYGMQPAQLGTDPALPPPAVVEPPPGLVMGADGKQAGLRRRVQNIRWVPRSPQKRPRAARERHCLVRTVH